MNIYLHVKQKYDLTASYSTVRNCVLAPSII